MWAALLLLDLASTDTPTDKTLCCCCLSRELRHRYEFRMRNKSRCPKQEVTILVIFLVIQAIAAVKTPGRRPEAGGATIAQSIRRSSNAIHEPSDLAVKEQEHSAMPPTTKKARQRNPSTTSTQVRDRRRRKQGRDAMLHEVPSGPNPISNAIPVKFISPGKLPIPAKTLHH